ncbi:MAG: aminotransferase class I/II-fold pyridoxal phosphate-dependent enzyme [Minwuia sp.]|nr:aminotransferase class I/II-fold pyridoxal phosphate-dependent enzyme [Minwuia sp.]
MLSPRKWVPETSEARVREIAGRTAAEPAQRTADQIRALARRSRDIHERECFNLNPATNVMSPAAEAILSSGMGTRASLGYPGDKYETGLEAIEEIEVIAAELAAQVFDARFAEIRVPSGAIANLFAFMATCKPGDTIIAPPATIGGHVTHHLTGSAGLYGLQTVPAPVDADGYTIDVAALRKVAEDVRPKLITVGGSLNLFEHPVADVRAIADSVGAKVLHDAAHQCGVIAGKAWRNPLADGAHLMTMSTYKSLGGPAGGLIVSNDAGIAERLDAIAYPGMTANFDAAKSAALALTLLDWMTHGQDYAAEMVASAQVFASTLSDAGIPVFASAWGFTTSHQFAVEAARFGGGQTASRKLRRAGFLACGIGLPIAPVAGDLNGLRIGTPELVRWGVKRDRVQDVAALVARALLSDTPEDLAEETRQLRAGFDRIHYVLEG